MRTLRLVPFVDRTLRDNPGEPSISKLPNAV